MVIKMMDTHCPCVHFISISCVCVFFSSSLSSFFRSLCFRILFFVMLLLLNFQLLAQFFRWKWNWRIFIKIFDWVCCKISNDKASIALKSKHLKINFSINSFAHCQLLGYVIVYWITFNPIECTLRNRIWATQQIHVTNLREKLKLK